MDIRKFVLVVGAIASLSVPATTRAEERTTVDADTQKLIVELLEVTGARKTMETAIPLIKQQALNISQKYRTHPDYDKIKQELDEIIEEETMFYLNASLQRFAPMYAEIFSHDELHQMVEFYKTPLGRKMVEKLPLVMQKALPIIQMEMPRFAQRLKTRVSDTLGKYRNEKEG